MRKFNKRIAIPYIALLSLLIIIPTLMILYKAMIVEGGLSLANIKEAMSSAYIELFKKSVFYATATTMFTILIGYPVAYAMWKVNKTAQMIILVFIMLPMWLNLVARTRALHAVLTVLKMESTTTAAIIGLVITFLPFMIISIYTQLLKIDKSYVEASNDLGASSTNTFWKIIFPLSVPGIMAGMLLVFLPSATTLVVPYLLNNGDRTIGNAIENLAYLAPGLASAIALLVTLAMLAFMFGISKVEKKFEVGDAND